MSTCGLCLLEETANRCLLSSSPRAERLLRVSIDFGDAWDSEAPSEKKKSESCQKDEGLAAGEHRCPNCDGEIDEFQCYGGYIVCGECGLCLDNVRLAQPTRAERTEAAAIGGPVVEEAAMGTGTIVHSSSAPYKRATYFAERLSQWSMSEPEIPDEDWELIEQEFTNICADRGWRCVIPTPEIGRAHV